MCIYIGFILNCVQQTINWVRAFKVVRTKFSTLGFFFLGHLLDIILVSFKCFHKFPLQSCLFFAFSHVLEIFKYCVPDRLSSGRAGWRITLHCELLWARAEHHRYQRRNHQEATARLVLVTNHNTSRKQCHKKLTKVSWNNSMFLKGTFYMSKIEAANLLLRSSF